jgi:hypothetical protein
LNRHQKVSFRTVRVNFHQPIVLVAGLLLCLFSVGCLKVIEPPVAPAAPEAYVKIATAKTVFVSNLGSDMTAANYIAGGANESYKAFYASLQQWGHFDLVDSPAKADLIFEIYTTVRPDNKESIGPGLGNNSYQVTSYPAVITLTMKDASTLNVLWSTHYNIILYGNTTKGEQQHFVQQMQGLMNEIEGLVPTSGAVSTRSK